MCDSLQVLAGDLYNWGYLSHILHRAGGASTETYVSGLISSCQSFCEAKMQPGGPWFGNSDVYYGKCYNAISPTPLNAIRVAYPSQQGTTDLEPNFLTNGPTNVTSCLRMTFKTES